MSISLQNFGLFKVTNDEEKYYSAECIIARCPPSDLVRHYFFEAADDESAKLIYEVGGYE